MSIDDHLSTVNAIIGSYRKHAETNPRASEWIGKLRGLADFLTEQKRLVAPIPKDLGDLSDLPEELIAELSVKRTDELEDQILTVMRACDGGKLVTIDQVLVGLFRKFKVVQTRRFIQNKLYRMFKKDLIYPVSGKRAYSLEPQPGAPDPEGYEDDSLHAAAPSVRNRNADLDDEIPF